MAITLEGTTYTDGTTTWSPNRDGAYEIGSLDQLKFFRDAVNDGNTFAGQTVLLTASIDLNNEEWTPIGKSGKTFQGTFDGQGNTVSNLYINTPTQDDVGFFGFTSVGEIKNLTIENANVTGYLDVGAVAGTPYTSKYTNITLKGEVKVQGFAYVGGMFGKNVYANLTDLTIDAAEGSYVTADSGAYRTYVGGVIGFMGEGNIVVKDVISNINVSGSSCDVGGITGIAHYNNSFINVTCTADEVVLVNAVDEGDQLEVGGIAGVWHNEANTAVQFINCTVENTQIKSTLNGVEQDVSANTISGKAYNAETATSGSQLIGQDVVIEENGKYSAGEFTVSGPNAVNVLNGKLADGLTVYPSADGTLSVDEAGDVAMIGDNRYKSLAKAVAVVPPGETITILTDITEETVSMTGFGIASWNNSTFTTTKKLAVDAGDNVLSGNVESAQLMLTGSKEENRTLTITESANVDLYIKGELTDGLLDVGFSLSKDVVKGDTGPRVYYAHVLVAGDVSVERYDEKGEADAGAVYIRPYSELVVTGNLDVVGEVHNRGSLVVDGGTMKMSKWLTPKLLGYTTGDSMTVTNGGFMDIYDAGAITFGEYSASEQHGPVSAQYADGMFATISAGGQFVADTLAFANDDDVTLTVTGEGSLFKLYTDSRTELSYYTYVQNEGKIIIADNAVFDVSGLANDNFVNTGTIDISSATATFATLTNAGTISLDYTSTLAFEAITNSGTITIDMSGYQSGLYKLLDYTGSGSYTEEQYKALIGEENWDKNFTVVDNDLYVTSERATFLYSSQVRMANGETVTVYANYSDAAADLEYRIGDTGDWLTYDAANGVNVSESTMVYFREQGIIDPVETEVYVAVVPMSEEVNSEVIYLAQTVNNNYYEATYAFADGTSKSVELSGNTVEHYALPEGTTVTIVEKDTDGALVKTIIEKTPVSATTSTVPDKVVAVDDDHDNLFFAISIGKWDGSYSAQHQGDGIWGGTMEIVSTKGKNRFSTVFVGGEDATTLFLTDDANGDVFFLDDVYTANGTDARISKMTEIQAGLGNDIVDLSSAKFSYEEHNSGELIVRGGDGNDVLWGNAGHNILFGDAGNDKLYGGSNNDTLIGGIGNDVMRGGGGNDIFCYGNSYNWGNDTITQLASGSVTLYLDGIDKADCQISGNTLTWDDGTFSGSIVLNGVSWDSVKFYCDANGDGLLTEIAEYDDLKNKGAFAAVSSH